MVEKFDTLFFFVNFFSFEDNINIIADHSSVNSSLLILRLNKRGPPSDEFESIVGEEIVRPISELLDSGLLPLCSLSVSVLVDVEIAARHIGTLLLPLVNQPIREPSLHCDELALSGQTKLKSSQSEDFSNIFDFGGFLQIFGIDVDCDELMELDVFVGDVLFEVEHRIDYLDFGDVVFFLVVAERLGDVDNDPKAQHLGSFRFILGGVRLELIQAYQVDLVLHEFQVRVLISHEVSTF